MNEKLQLIISKVSRVPFFLSFLCITMHICLCFVYVSVAIMLFVGLQLHSERIAKDNLQYDFVLHFILIDCVFNILMNDGSQAPQLMLYIANVRSHTSLYLTRSLVHSIHTSILKMSIDIDTLKIILQVFYVENWRKIYVIRIRLFRHLVRRRALSFLR